MRDEQEYILTMTVDNNIGVLTRITTQIRREGLNIRRLAVEETENPEVSRLTMTFSCLEGFYGGVLKRFSQMSCVHEITEGKSLGRVWK